MASILLQAAQPCLWCRFIGWLVYNSLQAADGDFSVAARMTPWERLIQRLAFWCCCTRSIMPTADEAEDSKWVQQAGRL